MKIAVLGVGSFVFGPSVLHDAIVEHQFPGLHLALYDPNGPAMQLMAGVAAQMAAAVGLKVQITTHDQLTEALSGADFVASAAAVQIKKRFEMDCATVRQHYPEHKITEFGGVAGISYTLRQAALLSNLAGHMRENCPGAWLLTSSNPLPRVCEVVHRIGIKIAGFCNNSSQVYEAIGRVMLGIHESYPWPAASARYFPEMAGVNHFTWLLSLVDRQTGRDVLGDFTQKLQEGVAGISVERPMTMELLSTYGKYPPNGDSHMADFVPPSPYVRSLEDSSHGTTDERQQRMAVLEEVAAGKRSFVDAMGHRAWEKPMDFVAAVAQRKEITFVSLNLANEGQLPQLPKDVFVETSARSANGSVVPTPAMLPPAIASVCRSTAELHSLIARAAMEGDYRALETAVDRDPTVIDKQRGRRALRACMEAHKDLIGNWC